MHPTVQLKPEKKFDIAGELFPKHERSKWDKIEVRNEEVANFTIEEIGEAFHNLRNKKSPGPDGIISEVAKVLFETAPDYCETLFNDLLQRGEFPKCWKKAKLVLTEKGKKNENGKMTYRPICLLNVLGKTMEHLIKGRLLHELKKTEIYPKINLDFGRGDPQLMLCKKSWS